MCQVFCWGPFFIYSPQQLRSPTPLCFRHASSSKKSTQLLPPLSSHSLLAPSWHINYQGYTEPSHRPALLLWAGGGRGLGLPQQLYVLPGPDPVLAPEGSSRREKETRPTKCQTSESLPIILDSRGGQRGSGRSCSETWYP